jgi:hypothetical protein
LAGAGQNQSLPAAAPTAQPTVVGRPAGNVAAPATSAPIQLNKRVMLSQMPTRITRKLGAEQALETFGLKAAGMGFGFTLPNTPFGISVSPEKKERLSGMSHWVDRDMLERAGEGYDQGLDGQAIADMEARRGGLTHPLAGAVLGALLSHSLTPKAPNSSKALGALFGAGAGAMLHQSTEDHRRRDAHEAFNGVHNERQKTRPASAIGGQPSTTANESRPLALNPGQGI